DYCMKYMQEFYPVHQKLVEKHGMDARYRSDEYLHCVINLYPEIVFELSQNLSQKEIYEIDIIDDNFMTLKYDSKRMEADFNAKDNFGCYYDHEFYNYKIDKEVMVKIDAYGDSMILDQIKRGGSYKDVKQCYQGIYYLNTPLKDFNGLVDNFYKTVDSTKYPYRGSKLISTIYTLERIDEYVVGRDDLTFVEQFFYLLVHEHPYLFMEPHQLIKEMMAFMETYCSDDFSILKMMRRDAQQKALREDLAREKAESYKEGQKKNQKDLTIFLADALREALKVRFDTVLIEVESYISAASFESLTEANQKVYFIQDQKEIIQYLIS
ncbi:MAG: hypothetical protein LUG46_08070, partial [Erysipelotrichaceae bacterium]|nr:hypothetical protein [Erysipelotrichaceae bacterium]